MMICHQNSVRGQCALARACTSQREEAFIEAVEVDVDEEVDEEVIEVGVEAEDDLEVEARRERGKSPR